MARQRIWKDSLYTGTWVTTRGQVFHCGPADLAHFHDRTKAMLQNGAAIPWCFEHQRDDDSETIGLSANDLHARWARNTGGHIHDVRISPAGPLEVLMDVDDADRPKLESIKFVSPDIRHNWRDRNGPASDEHGPFWPGQSIAHLAVTPMPVQYPQAPFQFDNAINQPVSLSAAAVNVSLSSALLRPDEKKIKDKTMAAKPPTPPKPDASASPPGGKPEGAAPPADGEVGEDMEGGGPITDDATGGDGDSALMAALAGEMSELGVEMHSSPDMDLKSFVEHLITAIKTHKSTKAGGDSDVDQNLDPSQATDPTQQEPEIAESAPIMMSSATTTTPLTEREKKWAKGLLKSNGANLRGRISVLHARGYIDDKIKGELEAELGNIRLSANDLTDDGDLKPSGVSIQVAAFERLVRSGKPGSFAKPSGKPAPPSAKPNPLKPISSIALSAGADEEVVEPPYDDGDSQDRPVDPDVVNRLSGGRYDAYREKNKKNGTPV